VQEGLAKLALCTALFSANQVVKSGDHAGQTPLCVGGGAHVCVCVCVYFVAPQMEEAASRYGELALNIFDKQP